jgi:mono/diheme cytochrome c family protein
MRAGTTVAIAAGSIAALVALGWWLAGLDPGGPPSLADRTSPERLALGKKVYDTHCAACHGAKLEGEPNWREKKPTGRMPAPPHDATGHTWHHPDAVLFGITKEGLVPGKYAPPGYQSDMPAYRGVLSDDEIRAVLGYVASTWPAREREHQARITREQARQR